MDGGGGMGGGERDVIVERERERENVSLTEVASVTSFSPKQMWHKN